MPKFLTYQRPAAVNKQNSGGKPATAYGKPGKKAPKSAPETRSPVLDIKMPGIVPPKPH